MWWQLVFWILLLPLIVIELTIFMRSKKLFWLVYALSIFAYVIAVSYTLDVFDASRNAIIVTLLVSAVVMALIGRHLGKGAQKRKGTRMPIVVAAVLIAAMAVLFAVSAWQGVAANSRSTVAPVESVSVQDLTRIVDDTKPNPLGDESVTLITRTVENRFFLPVPVRSLSVRVCLDTPTGFQELYLFERAEQNPEVAPHSTREIALTFSPLYVSEEQQGALVGKEILIYRLEDGAGTEMSYVPCEQMESPEWRIPITD
jgi:hypothetical protein